MAAQATDEERRAVATHLLDNGGDLRRSSRRQVDDDLARPAARAAGEARPTSAAEDQRAELGK